jgi:pyridoxal 5'-phosphate synthase pdxS subunit
MTFSKIIDAVTIPVMAKCRIGHFVEAQVYLGLECPIALLTSLQILQSIGVDYIDESEVLTPADEQVRQLSTAFRMTRT